MRDLYHITAAEAIDTMVEEVMTAHGVNKTTARRLIVNALLYNCVQDEILGQVEFLVNTEEDE